MTDLRVGPARDSLEPLLNLPLIGFARQSEDATGYGELGLETSAIAMERDDEDDFGLMSYDPAFLNTASTRSAITFLDGDRGILRYRGYPIEQLAESSTYLEAAYLLLYGELPTSAELAEWSVRSRSTRSCTRTSSD